MLNQSREHPSVLDANARECYGTARKIADPDARGELLSLIPKWHKLADMIAIDRCKLH